ncbi:MAG: hypothetical protein LBO63_04260 [Oscillospiraceae bacterium]|jgi:hypothetical protein|nr:hypothetical protein [Oscillospiraceae bacterium]
MIGKIIVVFFIAAVLLAGLLAGLCFLQVKLSKSKSKLPGLILPFITICSSLTFILGMSIEADTILSTVLTLLAMFMLCNIPTGLLLTVYIACREKQKLQRALEKMNVQDLK